MSVTSALRTYYAEQTAYFRGKFESACASLGSEAVHDMRVCLKRLRAYFDFCEVLDSTFVAADSLGPVRPLFRTAGKVRNLQVLEAGARQSTLDGALEVSEYYNWLKERERREAKRFYRACRRTDAAFFDSAWPRIAAVVKTRTARQTRRLAQDRLGGLLRVLKKEAHKPRTEPRLHAMRIQSKEARYTLEILLMLRPDDESLSSLDRLLRGVHQALGRWHDDRMVEESLSEFGKDSRLRLFSPDSYAKYGRMVRARQERDLADFGAAWTALDRFLIAAGSAMDTDETGSAAGPTVRGACGPRQKSLP